MIISEVKGKLKPNEDNVEKYPYIGVSSNNKIVLFISKDTGIIIVKNNVDQYFNHIGFYSNHWVEESFEKFNGEIVLKNT